jgi:hypothetical protein
MFHYFKIPYFTCYVFTKFTYNEYIGPYFLSHVVLGFSPSDLPEGALQNVLLCSDDRSLRVSREYNASKDLNCMTWKAQRGKL